ncbi:hypothetical protein JQC72_06550 [Polycladomyces sp. WAk]|uniref:Lipoprotein n=1 Tax=Polycladomyces zharkentensis TaxID=2807616 RepID=A0ABS2WI31_9BACL|nr:hypothetical protein [Polycladomyces sp. WAk]MBN2909181.1 hypothetical protein [Polycladomyces sp. WAk]
MNTKWHIFLSFTLFFLLLVGCNPVLNSESQVSTTKQQPKKLTLEEVLSNAKQHLKQNGARYQVSHSLSSDFDGNPLTIGFQGDTDMTYYPPAYYAEGTFHYKNIEESNEDQDEKLIKVYDDGNRFYLYNDKGWRTSMVTSDNPVRIFIPPHPAFTFFKFDDVNEQLATWKNSKAIQMTETNQSYIIKMMLNENTDETTNDIYLKEVQPFISLYKDKFGEDVK